MEENMANYEVNLRKSLIENLPDTRGELIFIYHMLGNILFKNSWDDTAGLLYDKSEMVQYNKLFGMVSLCKRCCKFDREFNENINFIFQKTLEKLQEMDNR